MKVVKKILIAYNRLIWRDIISKKFCCQELYNNKKLRIFPHNGKD